MKFFSLFFPYIYSEFIPILTAKKKYIQQLKDGEEESPEEEHEMEQEKPKQRVHSLSSSDNDDQDGDDTLQKKEVCAQRKVPAKRFKICYILCIRKPI